MSEISLYQKYLVLDMIVKRVEALGHKANTLSVSSPRWDAASIDSPQEQTYSFLYNASLTVDDMWGGEKVEKFAEKWIAAYPETVLLRRDGEIFLHGTAHNGLTWFIGAGRGVCEKVQVGTRRVTRIDPEWLENAPVVEVDEPVFEIICSDPLRELVDA